MSKDPLKSKAMSDYAKTHGGEVDKGSWASLEQRAIDKGQYNDQEKSGIMSAHSKDRGDVPKGGPVAGYQTRTDKPKWRNYKLKIATNIKDLV